MSYSLQVRHGDFVTTGASLGTVTREVKMTQDLTHWILERMGTDDVHMGYGSLLDGGTLPDGTEVEGVIGTYDWELAALEVERDLRRIISEYQAIQLRRAKGDRTTYGRGTLTPEEVVMEVPSIDYTQAVDVLIVTINIVTASNAYLQIALP